MKLWENILHHEIMSQLGILFMDKDYLTTVVEVSVELIVSKLACTYKKKKKKKLNSRTLISHFYFRSKFVNNVQNLFLFLTEGGRVQNLF